MNRVRQVRIDNDRDGMPDLVRFLIDLEGKQPGQYEAAESYSESGFEEDLAANPTADLAVDVWSETGEPGAVTIAARAPKAGEVESSTADTSDTWASGASRLPCSGQELRFCWC